MGKGWEFCLSKQGRVFIENLIIISGPDIRLTQCQPQDFPIIGTRPILSFAQNMFNDKVEPTQEPGASGTDPRTGRWWHRPKNRKILKL